MSETSLKKKPWEVYFRCVKCHILMDKDTRWYSEVCPGCGRTPTFILLDATTYSRRWVYKSQTRWARWTRWMRRTQQSGHWEYKNTDPFISKPAHSGVPKTKSTPIKELRATQEKSWSNLDNLWMDFYKGND